MNNDPQRKDPPGKSDPGPAEFPPAPRPAFNSQPHASREAPTCDEVAEQATHAALNAIVLDSQNAPQRYLDETAVPGGGE